ncbi:hypothetical protein IF1G_10083 [Cordyceps javanica]|uniref:Uncharacterized protein n=1 Tax=Cordyceps javanica TaxID=43265 RepID=A0A545UP09_9HYPO|nr:hypothetical protein IF1G_10083 [Cordyceps javanica]
MELTASTHRRGPSFPSTFFFSFSHCATISLCNDVLTVVCTNLPDASHRRMTVPASLATSKGQAGSSILASVTWRLALSGLGAMLELIIPPLPLLPASPLFDGVTARGRGGLRCGCSPNLPLSVGEEGGWVVAEPE